LFIIDIRGEVGVNDQTVNMLSQLGYIRCWGITLEHTSHDMIWIITDCGRPSFQRSELS
jgi:hypothetical protein